MPSKHGRARARDGNHLLARLPAPERRAVEAGCRPVDLEFGTVLAEADAPLAHVYFPLAGFVSLLAPARPRGSLEVGLIGREGMLGATLALDVEAAPLQALVQGAGTALRMPAAAFRRELAARPRLRELVLQYCYVSLCQLALAATCTHYHSIEARLARWLLMTQDRAAGAPFHLTQAFLGQMLGARRVGITHAAGALQRRGLIGYMRGEIVVRDRRGLEAASCRCYAASRRIERRAIAGYVR